MLYPLSYEGASAQSSDLRVDPGWQGLARVDLGRSARCGRASTTRIASTTGTRGPGWRAVQLVDPGWHLLESLRPAHPMILGSIIRRLLAACPCSASVIIDPKDPMAARRYRPQVQATRAAVLVECGGHLAPHVGDQLLDVAVRAVGDDACGRVEHLMPFRSTWC